MQNTFSSGTLKRNKNGSGTGRIDARASIKGLGRANFHTPPVGARNTHPAPVCLEDASANSDRHPGGQYRISLFGILGCDRVRHADARRQQPPACVQAKVAAESKAPSPSPIRLTPTRDCLAVFATVASHEGRELADVLTEALSEQADRWARTRHALLIDPRDQALLDDYLDALAADPDRLERMEEEVAYARATTPMMEAAARASDKCDAFRADDHDTADFLARHGAEDGIGITVSMQD